MKKSKKILSALLALIMMISIIPLSSITASALTSGACGDNLTWTFDESTGTLTISGTGEMYDYNWNIRPWESYKEIIENVVINDGVTTIGDYAFGACTSLTSIDIPNSVTTIGDFAFEGCTSLTSVTIPDNVISIGDGAFMYCESIKSMVIPDNVTSIGYEVFSSCNSLTRVTIGDGISTISSGAFKYCTNLINVAIGDGVTIIEGASFYDCTSMTSIIIPDGVMVIDNWAFGGCTSLTSVTIPDSVISIGDCTFSSCTSMTSIIIGDSLKSIGYGSFEFCDSLTDVYYVGTEDEWKDIRIENDNNANYPLLNATIHYNYHIHKYNFVTTVPTCTTQGYTTYTCSCGDSYVDDYVNASGHADNDGDGYCDDCNELLDPTVECECNCHKSGITKFFFNFILFFQRLFGANKECACGIAHY